MGMVLRAARALLWMPPVEARKQAARAAEQARRMASPRCIPAAGPAPCAPHPSRLTFGSIRMQQHSGLCRRRCSQSMRAGNSASCIGKGRAKSEHENTRDKPVQLLASLPSPLAYHGPGAGEAAPGFQPRPPSGQNRTRSDRHGQGARCDKAAICLDAERERRLPCCDQRIS